MAVARPVNHETTFPLHTVAKLTWFNVEPISIDEVEFGPDEEVVSWFLQPPSNIVEC